MVLFSLVCSDTLVPLPPIVSSQITFSPPCRFWHRDCRRGASLFRVPVFRRRQCGCNLPACLWRSEAAAAFVLLLSLTTPCCPIIYDISAVEAGFRFALAPGRSGLFGADCGGGQRGGRGGWPACGNRNCGCSNWTRKSHRVLSCLSGWLHLFSVL